MKDKPEISGNDVADEIEAGDRRHAAREAAVRRACEVMGWDYHQSPAWTGIRRVALGEAVAISVEKLNALLDELQRCKLQVSTLEKVSAASDEAWQAKLNEANRKANAAQVLNSNQRQMVNQAEIEKGALQLRIDNAVAELDALADLLADSEDVPVGRMPAVRLINEVLESLAGLPRKKGD